MAKVTGQSRPFSLPVADWQGQTVIGIIGFLESMQKLTTAILVASKEARIRVGYVPEVLAPSTFGSLLPSQSLEEARHAQAAADECWYSDLRTSLHIPCQI